MLQPARGNLLQADAEALVNTVNTVGVMGKGIALQFKRAYPDNYAKYSAACRRDEVRLGHIFVFETGRLANPRYILNFPTKQHWRSRSEIRDIEAGLEDLRRVIKQLKIRSVALPPVGCGNGGLAWRDVERLIHSTLGGLDDVLINVYEPTHTPRAEDMPVRTSRPRLTRFGAAVLLAAQRYLTLSIDAGFASEPKLSALEMHKVAYFLQVAKWLLRLNFTRGHYGPYSRDLDHFISSVEGHFISGYGDGTGGAKATLSLDQDAIVQANAVLGSDLHFRDAMSQFGRIVNGFEFPFGMELLSTVHYAASEPPVASDPDAVVGKVMSWSPRKRALIRPERAHLAYTHLSQTKVLT